MMRQLLMICILIAASASPADAEVARELTWDALVPSARPLEDPFAHLTYEQRTDLENLVQLEEVRVRTLGEDSTMLADAAGLILKLESEGLDVDALLTSYTELIAEIRRRNEAVVEELDGQLVRLPGYALPLEFNEGGVRELLLVPYFGACIHVPPPPPNQIVFVQLQRPFVPENRFTPVWITGRMSLARSTTALSYVDGQSDVATGYRLDGLEIEPYQN